jgi:hypothetical protein
VPVINRPFAGDNGGVRESAQELRNRPISCTKNPIGMENCAETSGTGFSDTPSQALCYRLGPFVSMGQHHTNALEEIVTLKQQLVQQAEKRRQRPPEK